ncbi:flavonol 7-O-beta-glucosyltransferase UGT74F1-like [Magnolia sinica]|uniref:flavonol 7-O-beta-glucosyltransferase UGT74F1-like n=1 Tax=Magnolia sinica TaxID=86752 RepID=UPI0026596EC0|nr:flavonol 7-O-beta-glucosyltransferase UGT74F1-like [Magnolia sinica]
MNKGKEAYRAHVLLLPYPSQGHINPMLQFAKRLVSKGIKATLATTLFISSSAQFDTSSVSVESISDGYDQGGSTEAGSLEAYLEGLETAGSRTLAELIERLDRLGHTIACLVYDTSLPWALDVAKQFGIYGAAFFTQSCTVDAIYYHVYLGKLTAPLEVTTVALPGLPPLEIPDMPTFFSASGFHPSHLPLVLNPFTNVDKADWVLLNTFDSLESEVVKWIAKMWPTKTIGPTVPSMFLDKRVRDDKDYSINLVKPDSSTCMKWLDERATNSVVYISFGSVAKLGVDHMEELAWGLGGSKKHFLWVVRGTEKDKLPPNLAESTAKMGLMVTWCPQLEVLAHQAVGCFVTHCGWNSTLEALSLGVPMVCVPQKTDQPTNAKCVEDVWGVGLRARIDEKGIVRREEMEFCIREVMEGERSEKFKRNASKWRELAKEAVDEGGSSDKNTDEFVSSLVLKKHKISN